MAPFFMKNTKVIASLCGIVAILLWSMVVGVVRDVTEHFTPLGGVALIETIGGIFLTCLMGWPVFSRKSAWILLVAGILFAGCEAGLAMALGFSHDRNQAMEVGIINYLWPTLTIFFGALINHQKIRPLVFPAVVIAMTGIVFVLGQGTFSLSALLNHISHRPICYVVALIDAVSWALYCAFMQRFGAEQKNVTGFFFLCTAAVLWAVYALAPGPRLEVPVTSIPVLLVAAVSLSGGYALWNLGMTNGNPRFLISLSYFTPVLSTVFYSFWLDTTLTRTFMEGAFLVTVGSFLCMLSGLRSNL